MEGIWKYFNVDNGWFSGNDSDDRATWNHWTGVVQYLKDTLGRKLTDKEITEISVSLGFGPTPLLSEKEKIAVFNAAHPDGNPRGIAIDQNTVSRLISRYTNY